jgi:hypothetical protein
MVSSSVTNLLDHSATISSDITPIYKADATDQGLIWGLDSTLSTSLTHAYYLNEASGSTVIDSFGNLNGTATGTSIVAGNAGSARSFNGTSEYITLPNSSDFNFGSNDFTISTWVYFTNVSKGYQMIIDRRGGSDCTGWILYLESDNTLNFLSASGGSWDNTTLSGSGVVPTVNTWSHIVVTRIGSTFTLYLNGVAIKSGTFTGFIGAQSQGPTIGLNHTNPGSGVQGKIDNIQIYNEGLSSTDIQSLYNNGNGLEKLNTVSKVSKGSPNNTSGTFLTADLTSLLSGTTYYFKPYTTVNGTSSYGEITSFTTSGQAMTSNNNCNLIIQIIRTTYHWSY